VSLALERCNTCHVKLICSITTSARRTSHESRQHSAHSPVGSAVGDLRLQLTQKTLLGEAAKVVAPRWRNSEPAAAAAEAAETRHWASAGPDRPA